MLRVPELTQSEKKLLKLHLCSAALSGISMGVLSLSDTILTKTLGGSELAVTILTGMTGAGFLLSIFWAGLLENRPKAPFIIWAALTGRLGLAFCGISTAPAWFITVVGLAWIAQAMITSAQVSIIRSSYPEKKRNQLFGCAVSIMTLSRLIVTVMLGKILDLNEHAYVLAFVVAGLCGVAGGYLLARMEKPVISKTMVKNDKRESTDKSDDCFYHPLREQRLNQGLQSVRASIHTVGSILKNDRRFRRFEFIFFIYGIAFLSLLPIIPYFLVHQLNMDYTNIGLAKGLMAQLGIILLTPFLGRKLDELKPIRFCARVFGFLACFPVLLIAAEWSQGFQDGLLTIPLTFAAFLCFGIAMGGISLAWNLSSIHFAGDRDPSAYQSVHSVMVGIRGVGAPVIGYLVMHYFSCSAGFAQSAALLISASILMTRMSRNEKKEALARKG